MPEPTPPMMAERPAEPLVYRPLSGLAIAGLACAAVYAALVLFSVVVAFLKREPFFLPSWMLILALAGAVLSGLALRQIRASEGTRAGATLARWGLWLSVLTGLGSWTFAFFTGLAVEQQASRFLTEKGPGSGFFPLLEQGEVNAAFLLTKAPRERQANPHNDAEMEKQYDISPDPKESRGLLTQFREADFVRLLGQPHNPPATVKALAVKGWAYEARSYKVERTYQIVTPEGQYDLPLTVQSFDSDVAGEGRKWMVVWRPWDTLQQIELTPLGQKRRAVRASAYNFAGAWLAKLYGQRSLEVYYDTKTPRERAAVHALAFARLCALGGSAAASVPGGARYQLLAVVDDPTVLLSALRKLDPGKGPIVLDRLRAAGDNNFRERVLSAGRLLATEANRVFREPPKISPNEERFARWEEKDGRLEIAFHVDFKLTLSGPGDPPFAVVLGRLVVAGDTGGAQDPTRSWHIVRLELDRAIPGALPPLTPPRRGPRK